MKKIEAIVRAELMTSVKQRLRELGVSGMTVSTVSGWSKQRELHLQWRGMPVSYDLISRVKFEIVASDPQVDDIVHTIVETARTGEHGDGIISISNIERAINIYHLGRT
ncbi:MAG TPA: P-II family nitrogen regulator [Nitrososphaeraceae archaeon]